MNKEIKVRISNKEGQLGFVFSRGGHRAGAGRKKIGVTKKVSLTLTEEIWEKIDEECSARQLSRSEVLRHILESAYGKESI